MDSPAPVIVRGTYLNKTFVAADSSAKSRPLPGKDPRRRAADPHHGTDRRRDLRADDLLRLRDVAEDGAVDARRSACADPPFVSGYDPEAAQSSFILEENLRLVEKPFDADVLRRTVREVLDEEAAEPVMAMAITGG